ncbi:Alpha/Beta hydrolase protein [Ilyonectria robusta]|uniref:Alpha/Beta hydrolase protein n=1 Tax=Ilyonectria robusta TaxID=1079257 RepID=UPI001E8DB102|nr:Alpha/Beta hydrolase protein [Ilyonectria robusta]KAH8675232.1 Alpha/Beta hydrolase protein [Ilyonectria robusta]
MDSVFARIAQDTSKFELGDEEIWRELYEPFHHKEVPNVAVIRDERYGPAERNLLDVFSPLDDTTVGKPVLLFVHGGGFFSGDKGWSEKCWANIGYFFAQQGIVVVVANHQLNSSAQYPAGADDIQLVREWIYESISHKKYGQGSPENVVLMGHSSGGAHIAMNLYAEGKSNTQRNVFPPVAGVIYLSVPFWYDRERPIRQKILRRYYGSDAEDVWGPRSALGLFRQLPEDSPLLKEACDGAIDFFNAYRAKSTPAGTLPIFHVLDKHNHLSNVLSIGTEDSVQAEKLLEFIRSCTHSRALNSKR